MATLASTRAFHVFHRHFQVVTPRFPRSLLEAPKPKRHPLHQPLPSLCPCVPPLTSSPKSLSITFSLPDGASSISATKVVDVDLSLAVKKKAMEISPVLKGTSIFLVGMNSTIKTNVGKLLADALRYYHFDSDSLVEEACGGESAAKSLKEQDEKGFRDSETEVLKQLSSMGRLVVCAGDGSVQSSTNLALLRHGISIWIDVPIEMVAKNMIEEGVQIPVTELSTAESYSEVFAQLAVVYEEMKGGYATADASVSLQKVASQLGYDDLDAVTTEDMAMEVLKEIQRLTRLKKMMEEAARPF
ncbi:probable inactive shikimate kinase like 1, chloroplastic isoform X4 [Vitis riparia]|uniref:probable inactive shikimate kinase like 1, chloroplastic isoform X4 n=1 Tax=Vitis riparia TaxID=96939 RepID=UPI00155A41C1|nr:probable inactive shikimate kinase like 1, chloroplastic isoform X4 [Vitis riparia]